MLAGKTERAETWVPSFAGTTKKGTGTMSDADLCYTVTAEVAAPARVAFDYLADGTKVGDWALGALEAKRVGKSDVFLSEQHGIAFRVDADAKRLLVDYHVGSGMKDLVMRIATRVIPGETMGRGAGTCLVSMAAWRPKSFDDRRWSRLKAFHDAEIHILREKIEAAQAKHR
jgi:hypothetical protein